MTNRETDSDLKNRLGFNPHELLKKKVWPAKIPEPASRYWGCKFYLPTCQICEYDGHSTTKYERDQFCQSSRYDFCQVPKKEKPLYFEGDVPANLGESEDTTTEGSLLKEIVVQSSAKRIEPGIGTVIATHNMLENLAEGRHKL